jgi:3-methyl-2-oxobutanoate hydroxymethyltransferase
MKNKLQPINIIKRKAEGKKIVVLTAYDYTMAKLIDSLEIDIILVGDSLGNVFSGFENTIPVTMEHMLYHTQAVARACQKTMIVADMPFLSYQVSAEKAKENAGRLIKFGGAQAVKVESQNSNLSTISAIVDMGIPVMGHIGFTPQTIYQQGGYRVQGRSTDDSAQILELAKKLEEIGCFSIILEMVPNKLAKKISEQISIPTIGIGAGPSCDGQVLVINDLLGMDTEFKPKFVKKYANLNRTIKTAINKYKKEVQNGEYPDVEHSYGD